MIDAVVDAAADAGTGDNGPMIDGLLELHDERMPAGATLESVDPEPRPRRVGGDDGAEHVRHLRMRADVDATGLATGRFSQPSSSVGVRFLGQPAFLGLAFTQFALPVVAGPALDFDFRPAPNLHSPSALGLLLARDADRFVLLAPIDHPHEQVLAVADGTLRWGWHGDLDDVSAGFGTTLGVYAGISAESLLRRWGSDVRRVRVAAADAGSTNPVVTHLSYWTDNGAAYWYRTEAGRTIGTSVAEAVESLRADDVPVQAVELDSWCYDHEVARPIAEIGYPEEVPPSGLMTWTPRRDAFDPPPAGRDAIEAFAERLGRPPLVIHARHISPRSPYVSDGWWVDQLAAHPSDPGFFRRWFDDAARWGVCAIEQDWMLMYWFGVRQLRAVPGRAAAWQRELDRLAGASGTGLIWCMATPADIVLAATLDHVVAVRTSDDYRFADDPATLWTWYLTVNRVAGALGLRSFKDCFFSRAAPATNAGHETIDGDPHAELEALLACMSAGPVGIGDRIGRTDRDVVMRTCDDDGRIRHVDRPLALVDDCLFGEPARGDRLAWATTTATSGGRVWHYVVAINTAEDRRVLADELPLHVLGIDGSRHVHEWRRGRGGPAESLQATLDPRDWALWVCAPQGQTDVGDTTKYVTVSAEVA